MDVDLTVEKEMKQVKSIKILMFGILTLLCSVSASAGSSWRAIDTPMYKIIYQEDIESEAQRVAGMMDAYLKEHLNVMPIDRELKKIPIVLYTHQHESNGNVGMMPYRSHWYNKPAMFAKLEWFDILAVHEGRHVVQFNQFLDHPAGKVAHFLMGESGTIGMLALFTPFWFIEGDAVVSETVLTQGGRGRSAAFDLWFRTDLLANEPYSYERAMLGTGFDRLPYLNYYVLGYFLTALAETEYSEQVFDKTLNSMATWDAFNFNGAFRLQTDVTLDEHYQQSMTELKKHWQSQLNQLEITPVEVIHNAGKNHWRSVYNVGFQGGQPVVLEADMKKTSKLAIVSDQDTLKPLTAMSLDIIGSQASTSKTREITTNGEDYCWVKNYAHPTKPNLAYGDVICWSQEAGLKQLTHGDKLTAVALLESGFIAHRFTEQRKSELVQFNADSKETKRWQLPAGSIAADLFVNGHEVYFVLASSRQDGLYRLSRDSGELAQLIDAGQESIRAPISTQNWVVYVSDRSGIDQLYAISKFTGERFQIAARPYGTYYPSFDAETARLLFNDYTSGGQQLVSIAFSDQPNADSDWIPVAQIETPDPLIQSLIPEQLPTIDENPDYASEAYSPYRHLWNPHSWYFLANNEGVEASIYSNDVMNKLSTVVSVGYDSDDSTGWTSVAAGYQLDAGPVLQPALAVDTEANVIASLGVSQSASWSKSVWHHSATIGTGVQWSNEEGDDEGWLLYGTGAFSQGREGAYQAISSKFGWWQQAYADQNDDREYRLQSTTGLLFGPSASTSLSAQLTLQELDNIDPLLEETAVFSELDQEGLSGRYQINAAWNPGAIGRGGSFIFLRNAEYGLHYAGQWDDEDTEEAVGLSVSPEINLFRNMIFQLTTQFAYYYRLDDESSRFTFGIGLGGE